MKSEDFITAARTMLGVRYRHQGRSAEFGVDCAGLAVVAARMCGVEVEDFTNYKRAPSVSEFLATMHKHCDVVPLGQEMPGDMWIFNFDNNPQHLAIQTSSEAEGKPARMIHSFSLQRKVVEHDMDPSWKAKRSVVFRVKEQ